jgi:glycosyltransferase involved in cell wall biosynthesis
MLKVCFVLSYRAPDYIRGRSICEALRRVPEVQLTLAVNRSRGIRRYWETVRALVLARKDFDPEIFILGFRGHEIAWLVRWLTRGKPLVIDAMMSPYAALKEEAKLGLPGKLLAPLWRKYESAILQQADAVLTDTRLHCEYYCNEFGLATDKITVVPVGAAEALSTELSPSERAPTEPLRVLFYGSFLPLHGVDLIIEAAALVADLPIEFQFIGGSPAQGERLRAACSEHGVTRYAHRAWVPFELLMRDEIPRSDLCLGGPFGGTPQARRVVTGKTSQCLAQGKATIVGRIDEDVGYVDRVNCLLVEQGNAKAIADAIRWALDHRSELAAIGQRGKVLYSQRLSTRVIGERMLPMLHRLVNKDAMGGAP